MSGKHDVVLDRGWLLLIRDLGLKPEEVLQSARLPPDLLSKPNRCVDVDDYFRLWRGIEARVGGSLPLRAGEVVTTEIFHPPIFAALCSPNLAVAVRRIGDYKRLIAPMVVTTEDRPDGFFVGMTWPEPSVDVPPSLAITELVFLVRIARIGAREPICPTAVVSPHPFEPEVEYERFFGAGVVRSNEHGVVFRHEDARRPFLTADDALWQTFEPNLRLRLSELDSSTALEERVRAVLLQNLPSGDPSIEGVARRLGMAPRTLQRRLRPVDVSFKDVLRRTREDLARHYVCDTDLAYSEISFLVGFDDPSSFFRAFREWTGLRPQQMRHPSSG